MIVVKKQIIFLFWLFCLPGYQVFSQAQTSRDNYTGAWETPATWDPVWQVPLIVISGSDAPTITINGYITVNNSLSFISNETNLIVNDTLVVKGDLSIDNNNDLTINDNGILIVWGNLTISNQSQIIANGYLIVIGNIYKGGTVFQGSWTSNDNPVKLFIGGTLPASLADNATNYPAVNCTLPVSTPYTNTGCSYGNLTDLAGDPIFVLLQTNCSITNVNTTLRACLAGAISLTSSYGTTYSWSGPNGFTSSLRNPIIPDASLAMAGNYRIIVTNAVCTDTDTVNVIVNPVPGIPTITASGPITFCEGNSVTLTSGEGSSYLWSTGATSESINVNVSGSYSVKVKNVYGCESAPSVPVVVTVNTLPVAPSITASGPTAFCAGGSVTLTSSAESAYIWSTGETTQNINVTLSGSYAVRVISASGCISDISVNTVVTVNSLPVATANSNSPVCLGSPLNLTGGPEGMTTYSWTGPDGFTAVSQNQSVSASTDLMAGVYTLSVTDANGCSNTAATTAVVNALPVVSAGADMTIPNGTSTAIEATVTGTGPFTYSWSPSGQLVNALIEDPATTILTTSTVFTLKGTSTSTSCFNTDEMTMTISGGPLSSISSALPETSCAGQDVQLRVLASGGSGSYTYTWTSVPSGFTSSVVDPVINPVVSTTYYVAVFDGFTTVNSEVTVTVNDLPLTPSITASGPTAFCAGENVTLTSSAGIDYIWSTGATTSSINVNVSGSYAVQVLNANGCKSALSAATVVTVNALPIIPFITAGGPTSFCPGGSVILTSSAETGYLWSTGATTQRTTITTAGNYTVQVTNANGCSSAASVATIVTLYNLPLTPTVTADGTAAICPGDSVTLTSSAETGYLWSTGATTPKINVKTAGSYTVRVTNSFGCRSDASAVTDVSLKALPSATAGSNSPVCAGNDITLTSSGGITYKWKGPDSYESNLQSPSITEAGTAMTGPYTVTVTADNGCAVTNTTNVSVNENPIANAGQVQVLKFISETEMQAELSSSETGEWSVLSGTGFFEDINSPVTRVTELSFGENIFLWKVLKDNCEDTATVKIIVYDPFIPSVITPNGDGKNDYFVIGEIIDQVEIIIFNRWGNEEYSNSNYLNDWDGRNNKGRELPNDTYFYVLKFGNIKIKKGSVLIKR